MSICQYLIINTQAEFDPIRWLDKSLIHLCSRFGDYQKDNPSSFVLSPRLSIIPQFIFNLRRSQFVQVLIYLLNLDYKFVKIHIFGFFLELEMVLLLLQLSLGLQQQPG